MAREDLIKLITQAISDPDFRAKLLAQPDEALKGFALDDDEAEMIRKLPGDAFDGMSVDLEDRQSKSGFLGGISLMGRKDAVDASSLLDLLKNKYG